MKNKTNIQLVKHIMETGSPMNQLFVIDALDKWSKHIIMNESKVLEQMKDGAIYGPAWVAAAKHVQAGLNSK